MQMSGMQSMSKVGDSTPLVHTPCSLACGGFAAFVQASATPSQGNSTISASEPPKHPDPEPATEVGPGSLVMDGLPIL